MTYSNVVSLFDYHWRAGLRPKAAAVMAGLSRVAAAARDDGRGEQGRLRAARAAGAGADREDPVSRSERMSVDEIREVERLDNTTQEPLVSGPVAQ